MEGDMEQLESRLSPMVEQAVAQHQLLAAQDTAAEAAAEAQHEAANGGASSSRVAFQPYDLAKHGPPLPPSDAARRRVTGAVRAACVPGDKDIASALRLLCTVFQMEAAGVTMLCANPDNEADYCGDVPYAVGPIVTPGVYKVRPICGYSLWTKGPEVTIIPDTSQDKRWIQGFEFIKFYASAPLISSAGYRLGTICLWSLETHPVNATQAAVLANVAELVVRRLEYNWAMSQTGTQKKRLLRSMKAYQMPMLFVDASPPHWRVLHMTSAAATAVGLEWDWEPFSFWEVFTTGTDNRKDEEELFLDAAAACLGDFSIQGLSLRNTKGSGLFTLMFWPAASEALDEHTLGPIGSPIDLAEEPTSFQNYYFAQVQGKPTATDAQLLGPQRPPAPAAAAIPVSEPLQPAASDAVKASHGPTTGPTTLSAEASGDEVEASDDGAEGSEQMPELQALDWPQTSTASGALMVTELAALGCGRPQLGPNFRPATTPITGLQLGALIGSGTSGRVFRGTYQGQPVAVKIVDYGTDVRMTPLGIPFETLEGLDSGLLATQAYAFAATEPNAAQSEPVGLTDAAMEQMASDPNSTKMVEDMEQWWVEQQEREQGDSPPAEGDAADTADRPCWLVMELCDRGRLRDACMQRSFSAAGAACMADSLINLLALLGVALDITMGMADLHSHDVIHTCFTAANVLLKSVPSRPHGFVAKVSDYGMLRSIAPLPVGLELQSEAHKADSLPTVVYKEDEARLDLAYQAPEVLLGAAMSKAANVYAFGVMLWEMYTGSPAWGGLGAEDVLQDVTVFRRPLQVPASMPPALADLMQECLTYEAEARPTFEELSGRLQMLKAAIGA